MFQLFRIFASVAIFVAFHTALFGSTFSIGPNGIHANDLKLPNQFPLTGSGINVGQVEAYRPAVFGTDAAGNSNVVPTSVALFNGQMIIDDENLGDEPSNPEPGHATEVASIIISTDTTDSSPQNGDAPQGVAPAALLHSSAYVNQDANTVAYEDAIVTLQYVTGITGMRAVNNSWGKAKESAGDPLDGNSKLTLAVDWLANKNKDVLQVVAGNEGAGGGPLPTDNYNGITVGMSSKAIDDGVFRAVSGGNSYDEDADGPRTSISLLAPGEAVEVAGLNFEETVAGGTSLAAPHVTGTIALLQEFGDRQIMDVGGSQWTPNARRHEVTKAVLINSADKIKDTGDGNLLGMEHTVVDGCDQFGQNCSTWLDSAAYTNDEIPLDLRMGAGHLNASRALKQFRNGEFSAGVTEVPTIGWDLGTTVGDDDIQKYTISQPLKADSFISVTLAWDREVVFQTDNGTEDFFNRGDEFLPECCLTDLDLYLMPVGETDLEQAVARSDSGAMTLEHIFFKIDVTQKYELWVQQFGSQLGGGIDYALAWWSVPATIASSQGDFDGSGFVDEQDYLVWRNASGSSNPNADANANGVVDAADYVIWRNNVGHVVTAGAGSGVGVPEPSIAMIVISLLMFHYARRVRLWDWLDHVKVPSI